MLNISTHKKILLQILSEIYSDSAIGPFLGFKGGTAAYFFYGLPRFSVDLDFDLLDKAKDNYVFEAIKKILKKYGNIIILNGNRGDIEDLKRSKSHFKG